MKYIYFKLWQYLFSVNGTASQWARRFVHLPSQIHWSTFGQMLSGAILVTCSACTTHVLNTPGSHLMVKSLLGCATLEVHNYYIWCSPSLRTHLYFVINYLLSNTRPVHNNWSSTVTSLPLSLSLCHTAVLCGVWESRSNPPLWSSHQ